MQQAADKTPFLKYFYKNCIPRLLAPLMAQTSDNHISKGMGKIKKYSFETVGFSKGVCLVT